MNSLLKKCRLRIFLRALVTALLLLCACIREERVRTVLLYASAAAFALKLLFDALDSFRELPGIPEERREEIEMLMGKAADKAVMFSELLMAVLALVLSVLAFRYESFFENLIQLVLIGSVLPSMLQNIIFISLLKKEP